MYARVSKFQADGELDETAVERMFGNVGPRVRELAGSLGTLLLADPSSGQMLSVTFWEDEAALRASDQAAAALRGDNGAQVSAKQNGDARSFQVVGFDIKKGAVT